MGFYYQASTISHIQLFHIFFLTSTFMCLNMDIFNISCGYVCKTSVKKILFYL